MLQHKIFMSQHNIMNCKPALLRHRNLYRDNLMHFVCKTHVVTILYVATFNKLQNLKFMLQHIILLSRHNLLCLILKMITTINSMLRLNDSPGISNVCRDKRLFMSQQITCKFQSALLR